MAIFHLNVDVISRGDGHSAVAAAAYRAGERIVETRTGEVHDYSRRSGVDHCEIIAPRGAPGWCKKRARLWNRAEDAERRADSQIARQIELALPRELSIKQRRRLVRRYVRKQFTSRGMVADVAYHDQDGENPHVHILLTMRRLAGAAFGAKKERAWNRRECVGEWRSGWARDVNAFLRRAGCRNRVDHRTLAAERADALAAGNDELAAKLDRAPGRHYGRAATAIQTRADRVESAAWAHSEALRIGEADQPDYRYVYEPSVPSTRVDDIREAMDQEEAERAAIRRAGELLAQARTALEKIANAARAAGLDDDAIDNIHSTAEAQEAGSGLEAVHLATKARVERRQKAEESARAVGVDVDSVSSGTRGRNTDLLKALESATERRQTEIKAEARTAGLDDEIINKLYDEAEAQRTGSGWTAVESATAAQVDRRKRAERVARRGCPRRSGKSVATPARLWYQSGVFKKEERPPMKKPYKIVSGASTPNRRELADWLAKDGQLLIPLVELLEKGERAIDEVIDVMGRATIEAVLRMSAEQVAGPKEQGRRDADRDLYWHGVQAGRVALKERQLRVDKPRLRKKRPRADEPGEVEIPAYTALQADQPLADRMLELVLQGVSTRKYEKVLPALADQVGVSKSEVSRETIEAGTRVLKELAERDLGKLDVLVVYLDGIVFGNYHVVAAVGVDADGRKHVLGLCGGASENTEVTAGLLEDLVARGLRADRRRLFVIDGAKALRQAIGRVFGSANLVQRCRNHKVRNVLGHLPKEQHEQARSTLRAAWKLDADEGIRKLEQYASWLEREWPSAAASLREGLSELFTVNRLGLPKPLRRCLTTTNIIDSSHAGVRQHTNRVSRWQSEEMAVRWAAVTFRETEKHYRRITGYEHLWMLKAHLDEENGALAELQKAG